MVEFVKRLRSAGRLIIGVSAQLRSGYRNAFARIHPAPVFVLGNQKSGTTAIASLLASHTGSAVTLDIFFRCRGPVLAALLTQKLTLREFVRRHRGYFCVPVIKEPSLTFFYRELRECFPGAKFCWIVRDPRDNIRSILNRLRVPGDLNDIDDSYLEGFPADRGWRLILDGALFGMAGGNYIETLALRWNRTAQLAAKHRAEIYQLRYEDFSQDKAGSITRLAREVGLDPTHDISHEVDVQYQPRGNREIRWIDFFGARNLELIERTCHAMMTEFGYAATVEETDKP